MELDVKLLNDVLSLYEGLGVFLILFIGIHLIMLLFKFCDYLVRLQNEKEERLKKEIIDRYENKQNEENKD